MNENQPPAETEDNGLAAAVIAADDTGMVRGEQQIVHADIDDRLATTEG